MSRIVPVILAGGSGSRLWPMSRETRPKQLLELLSGRSLLQETVLRAECLRNSASPLVVCSESHAAAVAMELGELGRHADAIIVEQSGRNTAPALAVAALIASKTSRTPMLLALPADHAIQDSDAFAEAVDAAVGSAAEGHLVSFGVVPTRPETGYGYVRRGKARGGWFELSAFVEKPDAATAARYVASGEYLWNGGMFVLPAELYLGELGRHAPAILAACERAVAEATHDGSFIRLGASFLESPANSIDYAVMEKTDKAAVVPLDAGWSDIGSWSALHDAGEQDEDGNALRGDTVALECRGCYIASNSRLVAAVGLEEMIVVETADAVLVLPRSRAQDVKQIVDHLKQHNRREVRLPADALPPEKT